MIEFWPIHRVRLDFARHMKRLLLLVENLNMLFRRPATPMWVGNASATEPRIPARQRNRPVWMSTVPSAPFNLFR